MFDVKPLIEALRGIKAELSSLNGKAEQIKAFLTMRADQAVQITCDANNRLADLADQGEKAIKVLETINKGQDVIIANQVEGD